VIASVSAPGFCQVSNRSPSITTVGVPKPP
jgi:hypothetical protein